MSLNITFGPVTINFGSRTFGPATASNTDTFVSLSVDRTVPVGLNSLDANSSILVVMEMSTDGINWHAVDTDQMGTLTSWSTYGGDQSYIDKHGVLQPVPKSAGRWPLFPGTSRELRATVTISGGVPIAVAGSLVTG